MKFVQKVLQLWTVLKQKYLTSNLRPKIKVVSEWVWKRRDWVLAIALILALFVIFKIKFTHKSTGTQDSQIINIQKDLAYYKDLNNNTVAKLEQEAVEKAQMRKAIDSLARELKIKPKFIKGVDRYDIQTVIEIKDRVVPVYLPSDTGKNKQPIAYNIEKHDAWLDASATVGKDGGEIHVVVRDSLTRVIKTRNPLFGPKTTTILLRNNSPYTQIKSGYSFVLKEKKPWLAIGPSITYSPFTPNKVVVGISATYPIITFKK